MNYYTFTNSHDLANASVRGLGHSGWWPGGLQHSTPFAQSSPTQSTAGTPWRQNRCLMLFMLVMGVCMCVPSAVALFVHHGGACDGGSNPEDNPWPDTQSNHGGAASGNVAEVGSGDETSSPIPAVDCTGTRFDGESLLLYLVFLLGLCVALSTLSCGFLCTPPSPETHGRWATLRRRVNAALGWDDGDDGGRTGGHDLPASAFSEAESVYSDVDDTMGGLRIFTGVLVQLPHDDASQSLSGSILVGVIDSDPSRPCSPATGPMKPHPYLYDVLAHGSPSAGGGAAFTPALSDASALQPASSPGRSGEGAVRAEADTMGVRMGWHTRDVDSEDSIGSSPHPAEHGVAAVCGSEDTCGSSDNGSRGASSPSEADSGCISAAQDADVHGDAGYEGELRDAAASPRSLHSDSTAAPASACCACAHGMEVDVPVDAPSGVLPAGEAASWSAWGDATGVLRLQRDAEIPGARDEQCVYAASDARAEAAIARLDSAESSGSYASGAGLSTSDIAGDTVGLHWQGQVSDALLREIQHGPQGT